MNRILIGLALCGLMASCGPRVQIPPSAVGKLNKDTGLEDTLRQPSSFRLNVGWFGANKEMLILLDCSDYANKEALKIFMPKDQLNLDVDVRYRVSVSKDPKKVNSLFGKMVASVSDDTGRVSTIDAKRVYETYGQNSLRTIVRNVLTQYSIAEVLLNRERLSVEINEALAKSVKDSNSPIEFSMTELSDMQPPSVIIKAQEAAKEKEVDLLKAEAETAIRMQQAASALQVAIKQQEVELKEAQTQALVDQALTAGMSETWLNMRLINVLQSMATNDTKVIIMPFEAMRNPAMLIGAQIEALKK